jgi:hypothetical protein
MRGLILGIGIGIIIAVGQALVQSTPPLGCLLIFSAALGLEEGHLLRESRKFFAVSYVLIAFQDISRASAADEQ